MYVTVDLESGTVALAEPSVFTAFHVEVTPGDAPLTAVDGVLQADGVAAEADHIWIRVDAIRRWAGPVADATWDTDFGAMVRYATTKGWCNEDASMIKAHIRRADVTD